MGTCFGRCINKKNKKKLFQSPRSMYSRETDHVEFDFLVDEMSNRESKSSTGISYLLTFKRKKRVPREVTLELTDDTWTRQTATSRFRGSAATRFQSTSSEEPQFQPLDARSLLTRGLLMSSRQRSSTSTPASSLDLEWEHESGLPMHPFHYAMEEETCELNVTPQPTPTPSHAWSRVSSPDSLEWDPVEAPLSDGLDAETEQLLTEIERLTSRALRETGDWTS